MGLGLFVLLLDPAFEKPVRRIILKLFNQRVYGRIHLARRQRSRFLPTSAARLSLLEGWLFVPCRKGGKLLCRRRSAPEHQSFLRSNSDPRVGRGRLRFN